MDTEIKEKWLKALRSGKYTQGKGNMCKKINNKGEAHHCCLGVLCEVLELDKIVDNEGLVYYGEKWKEFKSSVPPTNITTGLGIAENNIYKYASLNDRGYGFNEIADQIEKDYS